DYTNDECMNMFTYGQAKKMRALFSLNGSKNSFLYSGKSDSTSVSGSALPNTSENNINNNKPLPNISIYPNPVGQFLNLMPTDGFVLNGKSATILNASGIALIQKKLTSNNEKLDLSGLSKGIYFLHIADGKEKTVLKLIKM
ncbi:MAG: T9SS type A sorting domain-containing protein, partial [Ferruginibacter sp.]|nr:T9SS type A sorting domain-containing protein [Ferruginibacter sp.]